MKPHVLLTLFLLATSGAASAHDPGAPPPTWNREISRIVYERCASCHRPGGSSFSLMTYPEAQLKAVAIKTAVLSRQMPPWGAVKGFGDFRNDSGLTQEQLSLITDWVEGGAPKGNNPNALPSPPKFDRAPSPVKPPAHTIAVSGDVAIKHESFSTGCCRPRHRRAPRCRCCGPAGRPDRAADCGCMSTKTAIAIHFCFADPSTFRPVPSFAACRTNATILLIAGDGVEAVNLRTRRRAVCLMALVVAAGIGCGRREA